MAIYRTVALSFWTDSKVTEEFTPEDRYFYLYLFTNPHTNLAGCYEISIRQISLETGYSTETINRLLQRFSEIHKVAYYSTETREVLIYNWHKYNWTSSEKFRKPLEREIAAIKNSSFKEYLTAIFNGEKNVSLGGRYRIDTYCSDTPVLFCSVTDTVTDTDTEPKKTDDRFEQFWGAYPCKKNQNAAARAWVSINPDEETFNAIMESIAAHKARDADWIQGYGIPYADKYLFDERWKDAVVEKKPKKNQFNSFEQRDRTVTDFAEIERKKLLRSAGG